MRFYGWTWVMSYGSIEQDSVAIMESDKKLTIDGPPASSPSVVKGHDDDTASSTNVYQLFREDGTNTGHRNHRDQLGWILIRQLSVACVVCNAGPRLASLYQHWRCITDHRPPTYSFDEDTGDLILDKNLSYPVHKSTRRVPVSLLLTSALGPLILLAVASWMLSGVHHNGYSEVEATGPLSRSIQLQTFCGFGGRTLSLQPRQLLETSAAMSGLMMAIGVSEVLTRMGKGTFMRRRPNYYSLCGFDPETLQCERSGVCAANQSFPSGHTSLSMCAMMYLACYFGGKLLSSKYHMACKVVGCFTTSIPLLSWSVFVGMTSIMDHWHHPGDVVAGLFVGAASAVAVYHLYFPPLWNTQARGTPYTVWAVR